MFTGPAYHTRARVMLGAEGGQSRRGSQRPSQDARQLRDPHRRPGMPSGIPDHILNSFQNVEEFDNYQRVIRHDLNVARETLIRDETRHSTPSRPMRGISSARLGLNEFQESDQYIEDYTPYRDIDQEDQQSINPSGGNEVPATGAGTRMRDGNPLNFEITFGANFENMPDVERDNIPSRNNSGNGANYNGNRRNGGGDRRNGQAENNYINERGYDNPSRNVNNSHNVNQTSQATAPQIPFQPATNNRSMPQMGNQTANGSSSHNTPQDAESHMYDLLRTPMRFRRNYQTRQQQTVGLPRPLGQHTGPTQPMAQHTGTQQPVAQDMNQPLINCHIRGPEPRIPTFSGQRHDYAEWKNSFCMIMDAYPDNIKVPTLKEHLDPGSVLLVAYISVTDMDAYNQIWEQLDRKYQQGLSESHYHVGQLLQMIRRKRCVNIADLETVHNTLKYHWSKLCKMGPQYAAYAESVLVGISDILYGQSQSDVERLAFENRNFNVATVLNAIWNHIGQASSRLSRFTDENRHEKHKNAQYDSRTSTFATRFDQWKPFTAPTGNTNRRERTPPPNNLLPNTPTGSPLRQSQETRSRSSSPAFRGQSSNTNSPNRGSNSRQYRCTFCSTNDHTSIQCSRHSSEHCLGIVKAQNLCFKCLIPGHTTFICPFPTYCQSSDCSQVNMPKHAPSICKAMRAVSG